MSNLILPAQFDNTYRGRRAALWLLGVTVFVKTGIGINSILDGRQVASGADGLPLGAYGAACAQTVINDFALWGWQQIVLCLIAILALARYRAMVPLMFVVLLGEQLVRKLILVVLPVTTSGAGPGRWVNYGLLAVMAVGLALSLWRRNESQSSRGAPSPA